MLEIQKYPFAFTESERIFHLMFPELRWQVTFGTGKNGLKKWGSKKYVADFYWPEEKTIFEIDGKSHKTEYRQVCDKLRDLFFKGELGIKTVRLSNQQVKELFKKEEKRLIKGNEERNQQIFNSIFS